MSEPTPEQITIATLRGLAERALLIPPYPPMDNYRVGHSDGYRKAMQDVKAILDMNGRPPNEPVNFERNAG
jgi:hypothetical protein